jgi:hypothetical protein
LKRSSIGVGSLVLDCPAERHLAKKRQALVALLPCAESERAERGRDLCAIVAEDGRDELHHAFAEARSQLLRQAEVEQDHPAIALHQDVPRMGIAVKEAVHQDHLAEHVDQAAGELLRIGADLA